MHNFIGQLDVNNANVDFISYSVAIKLKREILHDNR